MCSTPAECNRQMREVEEKNNAYLADNPNSHSYLYPSLDDPHFNVKISQRTEFNDAPYDGTIRDVKKHAEFMQNAEFELLPQQAFVRNFMSFQTPYNSLLLYHGLGSGKTCTAIGVCEEMRDYLSQMGIQKQIIIVASPNVQDNFRRQLFDERKLTQVDGIWSTTGCIGNKLLQEINPTNMKGLTEENVISQVRNLINTYYSFQGYVQFSNDIARTASKAKTKQGKIQLLEAKFSNRLVIIDEVHNIRISDDNANKNVAKNLMFLVSVVSNLRMLLLSATPMYNSYREIVWLLNLMNMNDRRSVVSVSDIFDAQGGWKKNKEGIEVGKELFIRKATGYISYIRGENPYTFPFRVYPDRFSIDHTFQSIHEYPKYQLNGQRIPDNKKMSKLSVFLTAIGEQQLVGYNYIMHVLRQRLKQDHGKITSFKYTDLQLPIEALNIVYPYAGLEQLTIPNVEFVEEMANEQDLSPDTSTSTEENQIPEEESPATNNDEEEEEVEEEEVEEEEATQSGGTTAGIDPAELTGKKGLQRVMQFVDSSSPPVKGMFEYKDDKLRIFNEAHLHKYSSKMHNICESIRDGKGLVLIYSSYLDAGLVPMALALEEMGFIRHGEQAKPLFKTPPTASIDVRTMTPPTDPKDFKPAKYTIISGDSRLSPSNDADMKAITNIDNADGEMIKVVLISKAGSEGLDFKCIRQVHILEPWYNINRIEQIIGRSVRNYSHIKLPFEQRNVQIYMYGTLLENAEEESADLYVYRMTELKAVVNGRPARLLKQISVDCRIHESQNHLTAENFKTIPENKDITQVLSDNQVLEHFEVGDLDNSSACDFMDCSFKCLPDLTIEDKQIMDTYSEQSMASSVDSIVNQIKRLFKDRFFYRKKELIAFLNHMRPYPITQIYNALTTMVETNVVLVDKFGRPGSMINIGDYYLFQPSELNANQISVYDRSVPIQFKRSAVKFHFETEEPPNLHEQPVNDDAILEMYNNYNIASNTNAITKKTDGWYSLCGIVIRKLIDEEHIVREPTPQKRLERLEYLLLEHMVDSLMMSDKLQVLNYLQTNKQPPVHSDGEKFYRFYGKIKSILMEKVIMHNGITAMVMFTGPSRINDLALVVLQNNKWVPASPEDRSDLEDTIIRKYQINSAMNEFVGFVGFERSKKYLVYQLKNTVNKRSTGFRCDQSGKESVVELLNKIDNQTFEGKKSSDGKNELCVRQELTMRCHQFYKRDGLTWFVDTETAIMNEFQQKDKK